MSDTAVIIIIIVVAVIVLAIVVWLLYLAAGLVLLFTAFVMELSPIVAILMFILFPPTLIVYLAGLAFIQFGVADALARSDSEQSAHAPAPSDSEQSADALARLDSEQSNVSQREGEAERARRRALGYDE